MASIKDVKRMCKEYVNCIGCPIKSGKFCGIHRFPDNADEIVDKWVAEHPTKTYAMDFFEKFPNAPRTTKGNPTPCIGAIYSEFHDEECPMEGCSECWNREMKEGAKNE